MAYITTEDIALRLGPSGYVQLTDDAGTGNANEAVVDAERLAAEGEVDSYLARRYRVPIDLSRHGELAGLLAAVALDLAEYRLHARRPPVPADVHERQRAALTWLSRVASGEVVLPSVAQVAGNSATGAVAATIGEAAVLSRDELAGL
ncbi:MAG: DUF1320 family protein [Phycisphaerales bacterium]|nr:DUF1320 family protein [Phycisphaerales bacterium]